MKKWNENWALPVKVLLAGAGIAVTAILVPLVVSAVAPPANTVIGNQATASYFDSTNTKQSVQSNQVNTTVAQIGGVTLSNDGTKTAAAGNTVSIPHTVTNTGNGSDTFTITAVDSVGQGTYTNIAIYSDPNGTGIPSGAPLCATPVSGSIPTCTTGFQQVIGGNNGTFPFIATYTIPVSATTPTTPFNTATVTVVPVTSTPSIPYPSGTVSRTDTVNLTTGAAFSSNKAIKAPAVAAPGSTVGGWPTVVTGGIASSSASCQTNWSTGLTSTSTCTYTVFTISYSNVGGSTGSYSVSDTLPTGFTYVTGSAVWSGLGGTALSESGGATGTTPNVINSTYTAATRKFSAVVSNVTPNTSGTISFVVLVNNTALAGSSTTTNTALFSTVDCPSCTPDVPTNSTPFPVTPVYKVIAANAKDVTTTDSPTPPAKSGTDLVEVTSAFLGSKVSFTNWVINKGNVVDTFNVSIDPTGNTFPAGTTFAFFQADGTPLLDTNSDGKPDTGPLAVDGSVAILVVATLPSTGTVPAGAVDALMTATSANSTTPVFDSVWDQVDAIKSAKVDLTNTLAGNLTSVNGGTTTSPCVAGSNCDLGQGPTANPTFTTTTTPGTPAKFPVFITNEVPSTTTTYNLTATVPPGYSYKFVDNTSGTATCASPTITSISVTAGATPGGPTDPLPSNEVPVLACVTPPAGTTPGVVLVSFKATSSTDPSITDTITDAVNVTKPIVPGMELGPLTVNNTTPNGGTTVQPETLTNTGTTACGQGSGFNVSVSIDNPDWQVSVYFDQNKDGVIQGSDPVINTLVSATTANLTTAIAGSLVPLNPAPGNTLGLPLLVKVFSPDGALIGSTATATLTVTDLGTVAGQTCPPTTAKISTTVTNGQLSVMKTQVKSAGTGTAPSLTCDGTVTTGFDVASVTAKPGDCIIYKVVASNKGNAPVNKVTLNDTVPAYTVYNATQPATQCSVTGASGGTPGFLVTGTPLTYVSCGNETNGVTLAPLGTITMFYAVQVQQ